MFWASISRILSQVNLQHTKVMANVLTDVMIIYLGCLLLNTSCGSPRCRFEGQPSNLQRGTALHTGKDLAVSPHIFLYELLPKELLCFRSGRLCSHLATYVGRALPATLLQTMVACVCSDFPPSSRGVLTTRYRAIDRYTRVRNSNYLQTHI